MSTFRWTEPREIAARLVAEDKLTNEQIAAQLGITPRALDYWIADAAFRARVNEHVTAYRAAVMSQGIADRVQRMTRLNRDWRRLQQVQEARAAAIDPDDATADDPLGFGSKGFRAAALASGFTSGNVVVEWVTTPTGGFKPQFKVDTGTLAELRNIEKQAAQELGQWSEKRENAVSGDMTVHVVYDDIISGDGE